MFSAASLSCVGTLQLLSLIVNVLTHHLHMLYTVRSVKNHSIRISLNIHIAFSNTNLNNVVASEQYRNKCHVLETSASNEIYSALFVLTHLSYSQTHF